MADAIPPSARLPGSLLLASGAAMVVLLAIHPEAGAKDFAGILAQEAASRATDAIVHGGFVLVLAIQMACYAIFSLGLARAVNAAVAGLVFFGFGAAFLSGSMLIDGLALPSIAARYVGVPEKIEYARVLYVFGGTVISLLMPLGIGLQSASVVAWGTGLLQMKRRAAGFAGIVVGVSILAAVVAGALTMNPIALMAGIAGLALWAMIAGATMIGSRR